MPFSGTRFGRYEFQSPDGAGAGGQVYRARDTRLGRTVAIKVSPRDAAAGPEHQRLLEQDARPASASTHAFICALCDKLSAGGGSANMDYPVTSPVNP